ncbi:UDP-N-acetylglucosamine--dolichyl-phosphate N-acetylglucosaminephosphotransferase [Astathelohania contejeani]|uniref:UDP-N-acetylglucosamine--dolichyl-phosphate N-acetylglucosaminephosphotransferase n=1 Tax=Astathelohania contejeani TaxID=164912 RepID=A0ABQ7I1Z1_9MICR|nr:UDP-N-acetylglucosamine--dolichyl-phosphate N-acetylglucosaminephosphotransferase [Thelohania contejeani]
MIIYLTAFSISLILTQFMKYKPILRNRDRLKTVSDMLPDGVGLAPAISFMITSYIFTDFRSTYILLVTLMGLIDDLYGLSWKYKIVFPSLMVKGKIMSLISIFIVNSVNILSGINGLEISQYLVMAFFMYRKTKDILFLIFILALLPLFAENAYPAQVFGGNTFSFFGGATLFYLAYRTNMVWYLMAHHHLQIFNFVLSIPQLIGVYPCPRHRMPTHIGKSLIPSKMVHGGYINLTLLNLILYCWGPMNEHVLYFIVHGLQIGISIIFDLFITLLENFIQKINI